MLRPVTAIAVACAFVLAGSASASIPDPPLGGPAARRLPERLLPLTMPLHARIGSPFGRRWGGFHAGIDIEGWARTDVHAAASGRVTSVGWLAHYEGYGMMVVIRHGQGLVTMYAHLARSFVRQGDWVERGQLIARAGCTGSCTGTHLHFEVHLHGKPVNPMRFLKPRG